VRAVLDTNVFVAGLLSLPHASSTPVLLIRHLVDGLYTLIISDALLGELRHTLRKPYFQRRISTATLNWFFGLIDDFATIVPLTSAVIGIASHAEDDLVLATALCGRADFLVTGDRQLLKLEQFQGIPIITPRQMLDILGQSPRPWPHLSER